MCPRPHATSETSVGIKSLTHAERVLIEDLHKIRQMRWGLFGVRLGIIIINLIIALIVILAVIPLGMDGLDVHVPEAGEMTWTLQGNVLHLSAPISVRNGGFYDLEDFSVALQVHDDTGDQVMNDRTEPVNLVAGKTTDVNLQLNLDIGNLSQEDKKKIVFEGTSFNVTANIETCYMMKLMKFGMTINNGMQWSPLINSFGVDQSEISHQLSGTQIEIVVPYHISPSNIVYGRVIGVSSELRNSTSIFGTGSDSVTLRPNTTGEFHYLMSQEATIWLTTHSDTLTIVINLTFVGTTTQGTFQYYWNTLGP